jgi:hypothetical protein
VPVQRHDGLLGVEKKSSGHSRSLHLKTVSISFKDPVSLPSGKEPSLPITYWIMSPWTEWCDSRELNPNPTSAGSFTRTTLDI